jgi:predicted ATPase
VYTKSEANAPIGDRPAPGRTHVRRPALDEVRLAHGVWADQHVQPFFTRDSLGANLPRTESVLAQYKNPADETPITELGNHFAEIQIYREFRTTQLSGARSGASTSWTKESLQDGGDNLALMLQEMDFRDRHEQIRAYLRRLCDRFEDVKVEISNGLARTFLRETGLVEMLSSIRMSDGTLKFLALLAALLHPKPPPLMCIEEPELGLPQMPCNW